MPALPRRLAAIAALILGSAMMTAQMANAQWIASGRWGTETHWRYVVPGTWLVLWPEDGSRAMASVHAEAANHDGRLALWCRPGTTDASGDAAATSGLVFSNYFGEMLQRPDGAIDQVAAQPAELAVDDRPFAVTLVYHTQDRHWTSVTGLDPVFLEAFGWGSRMDLRNGSGETVARFRLNASGAARSALRRACGI